MTHATTFRCGRFPEGEAHIRTPLGEIVTFVDGVATVADEALAAALREVPEDFQVTEDAPATPKITEEDRLRARANQPIEPDPEPAQAEPVDEDAETVTVTAAAIRKWAKEAGVNCPAKGKIPQAVADAYLAAHADN